MSSAIGPSEYVECGPPGSGPAPIIISVRDALGRAGYGWLREIVVTLECGGIVLRGRVPSFHLKQVAQVTVRSVAGVAVVRDELTVEGGDA
jgi:osmotically-inducible protein OsmY